ncbi:hypothetical protein HOB30_03735 [Candidatus Falkowbacteria bacterium]|jgi:hypothetical protein|nr:hypothetical protein [Candidatus Falkowbacteria bacterium]
MKISEMKELVPELLISKFEVNKTIVSKLNFKNNRQRARFLVEALRYWSAQKKGIFCQSNGVWTDQSRRSMNDEGCWYFTYKIPSTHSHCARAQEVVASIWGSCSTFNKLPFVEARGDREYGFLFTDLLKYAQAKSNSPKSISERLAFETNIIMKEMQRRNDRTPPCPSRSQGSQGYGRYETPRIIQTKINNRHEIAAFVTREQIDQRVFDRQFRLSLYVITGKKSKAQFVFAQNKYNREGSQMLKIARINKKSITVKTHKGERKVAFKPTT